MRQAAPDALPDALPHGAVLYHHNLGWQDAFYLFDAVRRGAVELRWYPSAVYLADNATKAPHKRRFLVVPDWAPERDLDMQLAARRLEARQQLRSGRFTVYEITELPAGDASWRACGLSPARALWPVLSGYPNAGGGAHPPASCPAEGEFLNPAVDAVTPQSR